LLPSFTDLPVSKPRFPDAHEKPPADWKGPVFQLSQDYPPLLPPPETYPWKAFDFRTQPLEYVWSVYNYACEGNLEVDWRVKSNKARAWYHVPWMHDGEDGREFIHGLTRERDSRPGDLSAQQLRRVQTWAVSLYNPPGGYTVGRVWRDPNAPDPTAAAFPEGTVSIKLLFTQATETEVPYLKGSPVWQAHVTDTTGSRSVCDMRLLQVDVAVRDSRADSTTGWVFGTFIYNGDLTAETPWKRVVPIGLMWGNDPGVAPSDTGSHALRETWINPEARPLVHTIGWAGRLGGPTDNPRSSCLSCHSTAQVPFRKRAVPDKSQPDADKLTYFRNVRAGTPFDSGAQSLDYSLQLAVGIDDFLRAQEAEAKKK
jgi:hypothetical protein